MTDAPASPKMTASSDATPAQAAPVGKPPADPIADLIRKHQAKIDPILALNTPDQMAAMEALGLSLDEFERRNADLLRKDAELIQRDREARGVINNISWASTAAAAATTFALREKIAKGNKLIQGVAIALVSFATNMLTQVVGVPLFLRKIRQESNDLAHAGADVIKRDLAVLFENEERKAAAASTPCVPKAQGQPVAEAAVALQALPAPHRPETSEASAPAASASSHASIQPRNASYAAQAAQDKATRNSGQSVGV